MRSDLEHLPDKKRRDLDRITRISQLNEVGSFDNATSVNVQAWDDTFGKHAQRPVCCCIIC